VKATTTIRIHDRPFRLLGHRKRLISPTSGASARGVEQTPPDIAAPTAIAEARRP
jgi:hypothetical protein